MAATHHKEDEYIVSYDSFGHPAEQIRTPESYDTCGVCIGQGNVAGEHCYACDGDGKSIREEVGND